MLRGLVIALLVLTVTAFAGRPVAYCAMRGTVETTAAPQPAGHCHQAPRPVRDQRPCMVDLGVDHLAPAAPAASAPALVPVVAADLGVVFAIASPRLAPSRLAVTAYESPPASITILRI